MRGDRLHIRFRISGGALLVGTTSIKTKQSNREVGRYDIPARGASRSVQDERDKAMRAAVRDLPRFRLYREHGPGQRRLPRYSSRSTTRLSVLDPNCPAGGRKKYDIRPLFSVPTANPVIIEVLGRNGWGRGQEVARASWCAQDPQGRGIFAEKSRRGSGYRYDAQRLVLRD